MVEQLIKEDVTVAFLGSVDGGKSTTVGVLTTGTLDDGKGSARQTVMRHPHEIETGNTSDRSFKSFETESRRYALIDLPGHEKYLRTAIKGLSTNMPDFAVICVSDKIPPITREHMSLAIAFDIPFIVVFTKTDFIPENIQKRLIRTFKKLIKKYRKPYEIKSIDDINTVVPDKITPYILTSNKTGKGIDLLLAMLDHYPIRENKITCKHFCVENVYYVEGHGTIVAGYSGIDISKNDQFLLGPMSDGEFHKIRVRNMHDDFRNDIKRLPAGRKGCLNINIPKSERRLIRSGMIITKTIPDGICTKIKAKVKINHHSTSISTGYSAYVNCGAVHGTATFTSINGVDDEVIRSDDIALVEMEFARPNYIGVGQALVFREGTTRGFGRVIELIS